MNGTLVIVARTPDDVDVRLEAATENLVALRSVIGEAFGPYLDGNVVDAWIEYPEGVDGPRLDWRDAFPSAEEIHAQAVAA